MFYDFKINDYKGDPIDLHRYENKVVLVINTATRCGFTKQYDELVALYREYRDKGFEILDCPCNQFLKQAPGDGMEIHNECVLRFDIDFTQTEKINVNGKDEHPLYRYLKNEVDGKRIRWNFTKFLIDRNGVVRARFDSRVTPKELKPYIEKLLFTNNF